MKKLLSAVTFLAGIIVGAFLLYMTIHKNMSDDFDKKEEVYKTAIKHVQENGKKTAQELADAAFEKEALELKLANLRREVVGKEGELGSLQEENLRLKAAIAQYEAAAAVTQTGTGIQEAGSEKPEESTDEKLLMELKDLLAKLEINPADRKLMRQLLDKAEHVESIEDLKEIVGKLRALIGDALTADPENADLLFNKGNACGLELVYLQPKIKENPMVYGPKMGEIAFEALDCFDKVIEKNPKDNDALLTRAFWRYHTPGKTAGAQEDFTELMKRAREQNFDQATGEQVFAGMAMTLAKAGRSDEARKAAEEGLTLYPQSERLRRLVEEMQK